jgi:hypothetical protein
MVIKAVNLWVGAALLTLFASAANAQTGEAAAQAELRRITQELLDAVAPGRADVWRRYLHERVIHVDENGTVRTKEELLKELTPLPPGLTGRLQIDAFKAEIHDSIAVVTHEDQEELDYFGQTLRSRFRSTDTWLRTPEGWRLIGQQIAAVLRDPPTMALSNEQLCAYNGEYALTKEIVASVQCTDGGLNVSRPDRPTVKYAPELLDVFFAPGQPRTRRIFTRDASGQITGFVDRREGEDVRWVKRR